MSFKQATVAEIEAEATRYQGVVGEKFAVNPNGYGLHVRCRGCGESGTHDRAYRMADAHSKCEVAA